MSNYYSGLGGIYGIPAYSQTSDPKALQGYANSIPPPKTKQPGIWDNVRDGIGYTTGYMGKLFTHSIANMPGNLWNVGAFVGDILLKAPATREAYFRSIADKSKSYEGHLADINQSIKNKLYPNPNSKLFYCDHLMREGTLDEILPDPKVKQAYQAIANAGGDERAVFNLPSYTQNAYKNYAKDLDLMGTAIDLLTSVPSGVGKVASKGLKQTVKDGFTNARTWLNNHPKTVLGATAGIWTLPPALAYGLPNKQEDTLDPFVKGILARDKVKESYERQNKLLQLYGYKFNEKIDLNDQTQRIKLLSKIYNNPEILK